MSKNSLFWRIFLPSIIVIFFLSGFFYLYLGVHRINLRNREYNSWLLRITNVYSEDFQKPVLDHNTEKINKLCQTLAKQTGIRITVIALDGEILGESDKVAYDLDNHKYREEFIVAKNGKNGFSMRKSTTFDKELAYCAIPLYHEDKVIAVVRSSTEINNDTAIFNHYLFICFLVFMAFSLLTFVLCFIIFNPIKSRLKEQLKAIDGFRHGVYNPVIDTSNPEELMNMSISIKKTSKYIRETIDSLTKTINSQLAILMSMGEGVIAIDCDHNIVAIYKVALKMLGIRPEDAIGKKIHQVVRNSTIIKVSDRVFQTNESVEDDFTIVKNSQILSLQVNASVVKDQNGCVIGAVIILNDITRLKNLENIRRDFVANVTHELKTPITSIKGSAETLSDGAFEDQEAREKFLSMIVRQTERLGIIIDDLLTLSRIEQGEEKATIELTPILINQILEQVKLEMSKRADNKNIKLLFSCPDNLIARGNENLLEQAVANLVDNAIKYTDKGGKIEVLASSNNKCLTIKVADTGIGIASEHLPRLFERFYRVDKARSRKDGGTGLGLAIVKHIALAHGGKVEVNSTPGLGSSFIITIPLI